ncbi:hypothetical protein LPJ73_001959 [Coemansia sp. RSA 2703]|nr:hypothetical protein LPJ73_001959 [Coemansia sp. RSA 2703]KAJ2360580.1 hypothetical protein IW150_007459 [Coemansia sp. RSA 2607]KAJ2388937.1 hypothetical protein GGI05_003645 [Coemansia sp. RSA 2603]
MVSFVCNYCQETLKKPKLDTHAQRCRNASFSCIDCSVDFVGTSYRQHTSCISEAEKYEGKLYKGKNSGANKSQRQQKQQQKPKSTVDQLTAVAKKKEEAVVQTSDATNGGKRKNKSKSDDGEKPDKKSKKAKSDWETEGLPRDPVDALVCAIAADIGASSEEKDQSFDAMKKRCIKMVRSHPENTVSKSQLKENFEKAILAALSAGKVQLSK